ncbi:MAG: hypothetical protein MJK14_10370, partial [Rivularia sp. ALOHA_DT_140]|nr:hypothetical protein [Rivularia sp. ALOHA_DT_140]
MNNKQSQMRFCNGNKDHRHQKQFFHMMLPALLQIGSAGILPVVIAVLGFSTISPAWAVALSSEKKAQPSIGSRLKKAQFTVEDVKGQDPKINLPSETSQTLRLLDTGKEVKGQDLLPSLISESSNILLPPQESIQLAEIGDSPVSPSSPGSSGSGSLFDQ